jgi:hypothetical protein
MYLLNVDHIRPEASQRRQEPRQFEWRIQPPLTGKPANERALNECVAQGARKLVLSIGGIQNEQDIVLRAQGHREARRIFSIVE